MSKLDPYELEVLQAFESGKLKPVAGKAELLRMRAAARATAIKDRRVQLSSNFIGPRMTMHLVKDLRFRVDLGDPIQLIKLDAHREALQCRGIYFLCEGVRTLEIFEPDSPRVVYIGKAANETIYSRCRKHKVALELGAATAPPPGIRPGRSFRAYRDSPGFDVSTIFLVPGFMKRRRSYEPACAEEYFLYQFAVRNGVPPAANTAHVRGDPPALADFS